MSAPIGGRGAFFRLDPARVDRESRSRAKMINFGIIYGMSAFGLATRLAIPPNEARSIIDAYFTQYPGIRDYMEGVKEEARIHGFVRTPFGRKLWIAEIGVPAANLGGDVAMLLTTVLGNDASTSVLAKLVEQEFNLHTNVAELRDYFMKASDHA